ncbi:hypothetical protein FBY39_0083 [Microbacterium sp. SLBN-146]|nr:hypothetical protein FBY39_0083 [Microbacterium sp. SLBN-146]
MTDIADALWARVDEGFYVGSHNGTFLGCIEVLSDGRFAALDAHTRPLSTHTRLDEAMHAVASTGADGSRE